MNNVVNFFVMIDAGHGGTETGTRFSDKLSEKEITLLLARRLRTELQNRGMNAVLAALEEALERVERALPATLSAQKRAG